MGSSLCALRSLFLFFFFLFFFSFFSCSFLHSLVCWIAFVFSRWFFPPRIHCVLALHGKITSLYIFAMYISVLAPTLVVLDVDGWKYHFNVKNTLMYVITLTSLHGLTTNTYPPRGETRVIHKAGCFLGPHFLRWLTALNPATTASSFF